MKYKILYVISAIIIILILLYFLNIITPLSITSPFLYKKMHDLIFFLIFGLIISLLFIISDIVNNIKENH